MMEKTTQRRKFLKMGAAALAMIPVMIASGRADAATNAPLRTALKYQPKPEGDKRCSDCLQFIPGKSATAVGGCKIIPNDTEIAPQAYCAGWVKKP